MYIVFFIFTGDIPFDLTKSAFPFIFFPQTCLRNIWVLVANFLFFKSPGTD